MNSMLKYCFAVLLLVVVVNVNAKTVIWSVLPKYETIKPYNPSLYLCKLDGKWGLMDAEGKLVLPVRYDFVTQPHEGMGLFGVLEGNRYKLHGFIRNDGSKLALDGKYYAVPEYSRFSEGMLCVADASGKQGFMDKKGEVVVACQFDAVRPFKEGLASIKKKHWVYYIREDYDESPKQNVVYSEWRDGRVTEGTSFKNGEAVVGYGDEYRVIDKSGRELRSFDASEWEVNPADYTLADGNAEETVEGGFLVPRYSDIEVVTENGKCGFRWNGEEILAPVLSNASPVDANQISIVTYDGKVGLLKIVEGELEATLQNGDNMATRVSVNAKGADMLRYVVTLPDEYVEHAQLLVDKGSGDFVDVSSSIVVDSNEWAYEFQPEIESEDDEVRVRCRLLYEGLELLNGETVLEVERPIRLRLSKPFVVTAQADIKTEMQEVAATIFNDSDRSVTVTGELSVNCNVNAAVSRSFTITIPKGASRRVSVSVKVATDEEATAIVRLNTGKRREAVVALRIY